MMTTPSTTSWVPGGNWAICMVVTMSTSSAAAEQGSNRSGRAAENQRPAENHGAKRLQRIALGVDMMQIRSLYQNRIEIGARAGIPVEAYARDHRELARFIAKFGGAKNDA